jgi:PAS domain S-box-containing protein
MGRIPVSHSNNETSLVNDLRVSEERHRLLAEHANDVIWTMGLDGEISYVSPAIFAVRGLTPEEAKSQTLDQIHTPDSQMRVASYFATLLADIETSAPLKAFHGDLEYYRKDGSILWTEVMAFPVQGSDGKVVEILGITRDISQRKRYEAELQLAHQETERVNQELRLANLELSRLAAIAQQQAEKEKADREDQEKMLAMLSHELKTPLATIRMLVSTLHQSKPEIDRAVRDMSDVINRCVQAGKLSDRRLVARNEPCDIAELLEDLIANSRYRPRIEYMPLSESGALLGDAQMLTMVMDNLIDNACRYSPANSLVVVSLTRAFAGECTEFRLDVRNLPGDAGWPDPSKLFEKYYRSPHAQRQTGSGMGLYLISGLATMMGARLEYVPSNDHIQFAFRLPFSDASGIGI